MRSSKGRRKRSRILSVISTLAMVVAILPFLAAPAFAAHETHWVNDDEATPAPPGTSCADAGYTTISAAVAAAHDGDTIEVCAGTYDEQVVIDGKSLTLNGAGPTTIIRPSSAAILTSVYTTGTQGGGAFFDGITIAAIIDVRGVGALGVTISNLLVDGEMITSLPAGAGHVSGIVYGETGGTIDDVTVEDTRFVSPASVRTYSIWLDAVGGTPVTVNVTGSIAREYGRNGINARGNSMTATIDGNTVDGPGTVGPDQVPNGVLVISGADGTVTDNTISENHYTGISFLGSGILLYQAASGMTVSGNEIFDVDDAVILAGTSATLVTDNDLHDNVKGVQIEQVGATNNNITQNRIVDNTYGIFLSTSAGTGNFANLNRIVSSVTESVHNESANLIETEDNWWGCNTGPNTAGCDATSGAVDYDPWLVLEVSSDENALQVGETATITADLTENSDGGDSGGFVPDGTPVDFSTDKGTIAPPSTTTTSGLATATLTNNGCCSGFATASATVDNETESVQVDFGTTETVNEDEEVTTDPADPADSEPTSGDEVQTNITAPNDNTTISILENEDGTTTTPPPGYTLMDVEVYIEVDPDSTPTNPIRIEFQLDESVVGATAPDDVAVLKDGVLVQDCVNPLVEEADPDPCVASRTAGPGTGDVTIVVYTSSASTWNFATASPGACTMFGTSGDDVIEGTPFDDVICALEGNDVVHGRGGDDEIYGDDGSDILYGDAGADELHGENGKDYLFGEGNADELFGGPGGDELFGGPGPDFLMGQDGDDRVVGNAGPDDLDGGADNDSIRGWGGTDSIDGGDGDDLIMGGSGADTIETGEGNNAVNSGGGTDTITTGNGNNEIAGGDGDDTISTGSGDDVINGGEGNDTIDAGEGSNSVNGGGGNDDISTGAGNDEVHGGDGDDTIFPGAGNNVVNAGEGNDSVIAPASDAPGNDDWNLGGGDDIALAGGGNDSVFGGSGLDDINGEDGDDLLRGGPDEDTIDGGAGTDTCYQNEGITPTTNCEAP